MRRLGLFPSIFGLVLLALVVSQLVAAGLLVLVRPPPPAAMAVGNIVAEIGGAGGENRLRLQHQAEPPDPDSSPAALRFGREIAAGLGVPAADVVLVPSRMQRGRLIYVDVGSEEGGEPRLVPTLAGPFTVHVRDPAGGWRAYTPRGEAVFDTIEQRFIALFLAGALIMLLPAVLLARRLARPFQQLADAAEALGRKPSGPVAPIAGPPEAVRAGSALAEMARRLDAHVLNRTQMVGALAHDLRTPLTRLAFRAESLPERVRSEFAADIAEMESMIAATLGYVRGTDPAGPRERLEICSLIDRIAEDFAVVGKELATHCPELLVVEADRGAVRRMLTNLVENAFAYGCTAEVRLFRRDEWALIEIHDTGPGLSKAEIARAFEPFYRAEGSRNRNSGGIGLGLPYAQLVAEAHGGDITLENRPTGGLCARVRLPLVAVGQGDVSEPLPCLTHTSPQLRISATSTADQSVA